MKKQSDAFKKIQAMRDINHSGKTKILAKDLSSVVYLYVSDLGNFCAVGYKGRSRAPSFAYRYETYEKRALSVSEWMNKQVKVKTEKKRERLLVVGDVLRASWGYEQTNIDYFMVVGLVGKTMVEVVEIGAKSIETESMQGSCIPDPDVVIGEKMRKRVDGYNVRIDECRTARKKDYEIVGGCKVYSADWFTAYA